MQFIWKSLFILQEACFHLAAGILIILNCLPNTILVVIGLIIGVIGNVTVICVYQIGLKNKGNGCFFIPIMATVDLMCVSFSAVYHIIKFTHFVTFPNSWVCKFFYYSTRVIITYSIMIMTAIAVTRFHQICQIMKCQITTSWLRIFIMFLQEYFLLSHIFPHFSFSELLKFTKTTSLGTCARKLITQPDRWIKEICYSF